MGRGLAFLFSGSIWHFRKVVSYPRAHRYWWSSWIVNQLWLTSRFRVLATCCTVLFWSHSCLHHGSDANFCCVNCRKVHIRSLVMYRFTEILLVWMWVPGRNWRPQQSKLGWNTDFHSQVWFMKNWANLIMNGERGELEVEDLLKEEVYEGPYSAHCFWSFRNSLGFSAPCDWPWATLKVHS